MNEKLQYATMLEIPVSTCNVTFRPTKKKRTKTKKQQNPEVVKEKLLSKINSEKEEPQNLDGDRTPASSTFVPISAGILIASKVVQDILEIK